MDNLVSIHNGQPITTSLVVSEVFGKNHSHVLRDIEALNCSADFRQSNFGLSSYVSQQNKNLPVYQITKDGFAFLVMGYKGKKAAKFKEDFIREFNKRRDSISGAHPLTRLELAQMIVESEKEREAAEKRSFMLEENVSRLEVVIDDQQETIKENKPKVEYFDMHMDSPELITTNTIAKELGMSARSLNAKLHEEGIQYNQGGKWFLYAKYQSDGLHGMKSHTIESNTTTNRSSVYMCWTPKGRKFILELIREASAS